MQSVIGKRILVPDGNVLADLEAAPISEAYMAVWFFGLAHELGHSTPGAADDVGLLGAAALEAGVRAELARLAARLSLDIDELTMQIRSDTRHPLRAEHFRGEVAADMFAASVLLQSTIDIMQRVKDRDFHPGRFAAEMAISANTIMFIERCAGIASILAGGDTAEAMQRYVVQPAGATMRLSGVQLYMASSLAGFYADSESPDEETRRQWSKIVEEAGDLYASEVGELDSGLAQAMRFALWPASGPSCEQLLKRLREDLLDTPASHGVKVELQEFCQLADACGVTGVAIDRLREVSTSRA